MEEDLNTKKRHVAYCIYLLTGTADDREMAASGTTKLGEYNSREAAVKALCTIISALSASEEIKPVYALRLSEIYCRGDEVVGEKNMRPLMSTSFNKDSKVDQWIAARYAEEQAVD